jgi:hypothetical protein
MCRPVGLVIRFALALVILLFIICCFMCEIDPSTHKGMHSIMLLQTGCGSSGIRAVLSVGRKPRVEWSFPRTYSL